MAPTSRVQDNPIDPQIQIHTPCIPANPNFFISYESLSGSLRRISTLFKKATIVPKKIINEQIISLCRPTFSVSSKFSQQFWNYMVLHKNELTINTINLIGQGENIFIQNYFFSIDSKFLISKD